MFSFKHSLLISISTSACAVLSSAALAQQSSSQSEKMVIVTGTRVQGMTAADSAAPITVLGTDALTHGTGSPDLRQQLGQAIPSLTPQQFGTDTAKIRRA